MQTLQGDYVALDHIQNIGFPKATPPTLNYQELYSVREGLLWLYFQIYSVEKRCREAGLTFCSGERYFNSAITSCMFHWFSVTLVNHCRLIGTMDYLHRANLKESALLDPKIAEKSARHTKDYVRSVCPDVLLWRDKVSAHFALTDVRKDDTVGTMTTGVSMHVGFTDRVRAAALKWEGCTLPSWSLTEEVERLAPRYWPDFQVYSPFAF